MPKYSPWRATLAVTAATFIAAVPVANAPSAHASTTAHVTQPYPPTTDDVEVSSTTVPAGDEINFVARGFTPGEQVVATLVLVSSGPGQANRASPLSHNQSTTFIANEHGTVIGCYEVPEGTPPGTYRFTLTGQKSGRVLAVEITVTGGNGGDEGDEREDAGLDMTAGTEMNRNEASLLVESDATGRTTVSMSQREAAPSLRSGTPGENAVASHLAADHGTAGLSPVGHTGSSHPGSALAGAVRSAPGAHGALIGLAAGLAMAGGGAVMVRRHRRRTRAGEG